MVDDHDLLSRHLLDTSGNGEKLDRARSQVPSKQPHTDLSIPEFRHWQRQLHSRLLCLEEEIHVLKRYQETYRLRLATPSESKSAITGQGLECELDRSFIQAYLQKLSPDILELELERYRVAASYNTRSPINRLPPEVLSNILCLASRCLFETRNEEPWIEYNHPISSMRWTHVCRYWRNAALNCAQLWNCLDLSRPKIVELILPRGRNASVTVTPPLRSPGEGISKALLNVLSSSMRRVRTFILDSAVVMAMPKSALLKKYLPDSLPVLEHLIVYGDSTTDEFLGQFLRRSFPSLRLLVIDIHYPTNRPLTDFPLGPTLTHFKVCGDIEDAYEEDGDRLSIVQLLSALRLLPNLQSLIIGGLLSDSAEPPPPQDAPPIRLPKLRHLSLLEHAFNVSTIFRILHIPVEVKVSLYCIDEGPDTYANRTITMVRLVKSLFGSFEETGRVQRDVSALCLNEHNFDIQFADLPGLAISDEGDGIETTALLDTLSIYIDFCTISSLTVDNQEPGTDLTSVWRFFGRSPFLRTLRVQQSSLMDLLDALEESPNPPFPNISMPSFPALKILELVDLEPDDETYDIDERECFYRLIRVLRQRIKSKYPLSQLWIEECNCFQQVEVYIIQQSLPSLHVVWDRYHLCPGRLLCTRPGACSTLTGYLQSSSSYDSLSSSSSSS